MIDPTWLHALAEAEYVERVTRAERASVAPQAPFWRLHSPLLFLLQSLATQWRRRSEAKRDTSSGYHDQCFAKHECT